MYLYPLLIFLGSLALLLPLLATPSNIGPQGLMAQQSLSADTLAQAVMTQQQATLTWARQNTGFVGTVSQSSLTLPAPWQPSGQIQTAIGSTTAGTIAVTWYAGSRVPAGAVGHALIQRAASAQDVGVTGVGMLTGVAGVTTPLPTPVPAGVAAMADLVSP